MDFPFRRSVIAFPSFRSASLVIWAKISSLPHIQAAVAAKAFSCMNIPGLVAPVFDPGSVWLVGAGPGDPGLLTLHAAHALDVADVVLHDALVAPEILALAAKARLEPVGKRAGRPSARQLRINERL